MKISLHHCLFAYCCHQHTSAEVHKWISTVHAKLTGSQHSSIHVRQQTIVCNTSTSHNLLSYIWCDLARSMQAVSFRPTRTWIFHHHGTFIYNSPYLHFSTVADI